MMAAMRTLWVDGNRQVHQTTERPPDGQTGWIDLDHAPDAALLAHFFAPHPMAVRQMTGEARGRGFFAYPDTLVFEVTAPEGDNPLDELKALRIALGSHFLLTAHTGRVKLVDRIWELARSGDSLAMGPDIMLYDLLTAQIHLFAEKKRELMEDYEALHDALLRHPTEDLSHRILGMRKSFLKLRLALGPESRALDFLARARVPWIDEDHQPYLEDMASALSDLVTEVDSVREGLSGTVEAYASVQSNEINKIMKFLTIISVLALPATTIASIYGMNFDMPELHWSFGYWYALSLMASVTGFLLWYMRRRDRFR